MGRWVVSGRSCSRGTTIRIYCMKNIFNEKGKGAPVITCYGPLVFCDSHKNESDPCPLRNSVSDAKPEGYPCNPFFFSKERGKQRGRSDGRFVCLVSGALIIKGSIWHAHRLDFVLKGRRFIEYL